MSAPGYAVIGIYRPGQSQPSLMSHHGRVIVFDTPEMARNYLPQLGGGRPTRWKDRDTAYWLPLQPKGVNRAVVLTDYDVYNLPPGAPIRSETRGRDWQRHVIWSQWLAGEA